MGLWLLTGVEAFGQLDMDRQLRERAAESEEYDDSDADRHGDALRSFYLTKRLGDKQSAWVDTIKLNFFHRSFIEGLSLAEAYNGNYASPYQSKVYFDRPMNKWDTFYFTHLFGHLIRRWERQQWYDAKVPFSLLTYNSTGSSNEQEQNLNVTISSNLGKRFSLGGDFDINYANGFYAYTGAKNIAYRVFTYYEGDRYQAYASVGNTNVIVQENGGITDMRYITHPDDFADGRRKILPKDIPTRYKSTWNRVVYGEGRLNHRYRFGFYEYLNEKGEVIPPPKRETKKEPKVDPLEPSGANLDTEQAPAELPSDSLPPASVLPLPTVERDSVAVPASRDSVSMLSDHLAMPKDSLAMPIDSLALPSDSLQQEASTPIVEEGDAEVPREPVATTPPKPRKRAGASSGVASADKEQEGNEGKDGDKKERRCFVPVASIFHDFALEKGRREWYSKDPIWEQRYPDPIIPKPAGATYFPNDSFRALRISNTVGLEVMEGFRKWAKMGLAAFVSYDIEHFYQPLMSWEDAERLDLEREVLSHKQQTIYAGGRLSSDSFKYFRYYAWGQIGVAGAKAGEIELEGELSTSNIRIAGQELRVSGTAHFLNTRPSYFLREYKASLHEWHQELKMIQALRVGGEVDIPQLGGRLYAQFETLQNPMVADAKGKPIQVSENVRVLAVGAEQRLAWQPFNLEVSALWQNSSDPKVIPLPDVSFYGNFYLKLIIAKVMTLQLGADAKWHTKYYAPYYEPSTQLFIPQREIEIGGTAPLLSAYANVHLKRARFFLKYYNLGALLFRPNSFTMPYYPLYPPQLRLGIAVDLRN